MLGDALLSPCLPASRSVCPRSTVTLAHRALSLPGVLDPLSTERAVPGPEPDQGESQVGARPRRCLGDAPGAAGPGSHPAVSLSPCCVPLPWGLAGGCVSPSAIPGGPNSVPPPNPSLPQEYSRGHPKREAPWGPSPKPGAVSSAAVGRPGPRCSGLSWICQCVAESHLFGGRGRNLWGFSSPLAFQNPSSDVLEGFSEAAPQKQASSSAF